MVPSDCEAATTPPNAAPKGLGRKPFAISWLASSGNRADIEFVTRAAAG
jgi:hypothetical protein